MLNKEQLREIKGGYGGGGGGSPCDIQPGDCDPQYGYFFADNWGCIGGTMYSCTYLGYPWQWHS